MENLLSFHLLSNHLAFSVSPTENVPVKLSPPSTVPTSIHIPLTSPPAAYPAVLVGRPSISCENKPKIPPPVPPRGTPKVKKGGISAKGAQHDHQQLFGKSHDFLSHMSLLALNLLPERNFASFFYQSAFNNSSTRSDYSFLELPASESNTSNRILKRTQTYPYYSRNIAYTHMLGLPTNYAQNTRNNFKNYAYDNLSMLTDDYEMQSDYSFCIPYIKTYRFIDKNKIGSENNCIPSIHVQDFSEDTIHYDIDDLV